MFRSKMEAFRLQFLVIVAVWIGGAQFAASAQTKFLANFDNNGPFNQGQLGPSNLISQGWIFRVQATQPVQGFVDGFVNFFQSELGPGYLAAFVVLPDTGPYGGWAILPAVAGQGPGDPLTFWVQGLTDQTTILEARYSPAGGINTGTAPSDVGDFTTALLTVGPIPNGGWQQFSVNLPGSGRIALRVVGQYVLFGYNSYVGIDSLTVGTPLPPPCNLPPQPAPGQTVTWTAANSPYQLCIDLTIPKGGTVNVEPGVQLQAQGHTLAISGIVNAPGTATSHISISAQDVFPPAITMSNGSLNLKFADITGQIRGGPGKLIISDSIFTGPNGLIWTPDILLPSLPPVVKLTRCTFNNSSMQITDSFLALSNSKFSNSSASVLRGYTRLLGTNRLDGQPLTILRETAQAVQPLFVDGVKARNVATGGGVSLSGGNFLLGSKNLLTSNLYPLDIEGGLLPSSIVPLTGNSKNLIWAHDGGGGPTARWANLGLSYVVDGLIFGGGTLTIDPGVKVLFDPAKTGFAGLRFKSTRRLIAHGLPNASITFDALNPSVPWTMLSFEENGTEGNYLDYVTVQNAQMGVSVSDSFLDITNSLFQKNQTAVNTNTFGLANVSKTRLFSNGTGLEAKPEGSFLLNAPDLLPNWFEGNGTGILNNGSTIPAQNNYWGSPTGPTNPGNPGGKGDSIVGPVTFKPFLTSPPDIAKNPPVVRLTSLGNDWYGMDTITRPPDFVVSPGEKLILQWAVSNSTTVVSQRILLSPEGADYDSSLVQPIVLADNIPASATTMELTIPNVPFAVTNLPQFLRVVAMDSSGQQGWDQTPLIVSTGNINGTLEIAPDYAGKTFIGGHQEPQETWTGVTNGSEEGYIFLESDGGLFPTLGSILPLPMVSTDTARLVVISHNNSNDLKWFFAPGFFSIRPDAALGLKPPVVKLTSPVAGSTFAGGSVVPITWTASAQQSLRSFDIQVSTDRGQTFHLVTTNLGASVRSFNWQLPASTGIPDVRVRVIARDKVFQNSSDGASTVFSITP
jgi:hypothetical protein